MMRFSKCLENVCDCNYSHHVYCVGLQIYKIWKHYDCVTRFCMCFFFSHLQRNRGKEKKRPLHNKLTGEASFFLPQFYTFYQIFFLIHPTNIIKLHYFSWYSYSLTIFFSHYLHTLNMSNDRKCSVNMGKMGDVGSPNPCLTCWCFIYSSCVSLMFFFFSFLVNNKIVCDGKKNKCRLCQRKRSSTFQ